MSERLVQKYGSQIQAHLHEGERLIEVVHAIALKNVPKGHEAAKDGPIIGTGATAGRLLNAMPQRTAGLISVTDQRVLFFGTGAFSRLKQMWWETPRTTVARVQPSDRGLLFMIHFSDRSTAWFGGGRHHCAALATALEFSVP